MSHKTKELKELQDSKNQSKITSHFECVKMDTPRENKTNDKVSDLNTCSNISYRNGSLCTPRIRSGSLSGLERKRPLSSPDQAVQSVSKIQRETPDVELLLINLSTKIDKIGLKQGETNSQLSELQSDLKTVSSDLARLTNMCEQNTQRISDLKENMNSLESKCDSYATDIRNINENLVGMEIQVETLDKKNLTPELNNSIKQINYLHTIMINQTKSLKKGQVKQEAYSQRSNFIFNGVPEKRGEDCVRDD